MPITSSSFSPTTGIREKPLRSASDSAWRTVLSCSTNTMSVRGTMTSRTIVSPSSNTEWIIWRSPGSITWLSSSRSTSPRSSSSEAPPSRPPRPGVSALPTAISSRGSGPSARTMGVSTLAAAPASSRSYRRPSVAGQIPATMYSTAAMATSPIRYVRQSLPSNCTSPAVADTTAAVSLPTRTTMSTLRYRPGSARTACSLGEEPFGPGRPRSRPPALARRRKAISALAHRPATTASASAAAKSHAIAVSPRSVLLPRVPCGRFPGARFRRALAVRALGAPCVKQPVLQPEHGGPLVRLGMIVTEQVEDAVRAQHFQFVGHRVLRLTCLLRGHLGAEDHVAQHGRLGVRVRRPGPVTPVAARRRGSQLVHGEGQHIGGPLLPHPALVQVGDGRGVHQQNGQFRQRVHPQLVEHEPGQRREGGLVHAHPGFVGDLDAHEPAPVTGPACPDRGNAPAPPHGPPPGHGCRRPVPAPPPGPRCAPHRRRTRSRCRR